MEISAENPGVAIVTGAASGIGAAVARVLAARGTAVAAVDRDAERLRESVGKIAAEGGRIEAVAADVTDPAEVEGAVDRAAELLGPADYLVNAAGILRTGTAVELTERDWSETLAVNATGVFLMSQAVVRRMLPRRSGALVTIVSNAAGTARVAMSAYAASKAAAEMYTKCLGLEVAGHGIRCNLVAPGSTETPMLVGMWSDETGRDATINGSLESYKAGIPLRRLADPRNIADAVAFLLSDQASHITMHTLTVDGGATLGV
ncbi:MAG TPA: 2,3-dihydro-2,3-dihydroxybenzoate dehydrogenase [Actinospica sp.]|nr:2,3-dihydro-2,3-dihydroxybenzoate dehydrogenase [Actinospica sp.]